MMPENTKVRLTVDLTKYNPVCVKGAEGVTLAKDWNATNAPCRYRMRRVRHYV
jgi:hypothetical protein